MHSSRWQLLLASLGGSPNMLDWSQYFKSSNQFNTCSASEAEILRVETSSLQRYLAYVFL